MSSILLIIIGLINLLVLIIAALYTRKIWQDDVDGLRREIAALKNQRAGAIDLAPLRLTLEKKLDEARLAQNAQIESLKRQIAQTNDDAAPKAPSLDEPAKKAAKPAKKSDNTAPPQPSLDLDLGEDDLTTLSFSEWLCALNFPKNEDDKEGFNLLARAMELPQSRPLLRAAHDVLSILSQLGVYLDDLHPDDAAPNAWRAFAKGVRGAKVASLGQIGTAQLAVRVATRMRTDIVFRDAAHHYLRMFDRYLIDTAPNLSDDDFVALAETRSARAFMLLGRASGTFNADEA